MLALTVLPYDVEGTPLGGGGESSSICIFLQSITTASNVFTSFISSPRHARTDLFSASTSNIPSAAIFDDTGSVRGETLLAFWYQLQEEVWGIDWEEDACHEQVRLSTGA